MTYQPGEPPSYAQPQDPWSSGSTSPPTDPIPAPARAQFAPGVAPPAAPAPNVWSQETVLHGGGEQPGGRTGLYIFVTLLVLVLGGAGGIGAWYVIRERLNPATPGTTTDSPGPSTSDTNFTPSAIRVGDCLFNRTPDSTPTMVVVDCDTAGATKVLKIQSGEGIPENADKHFDNDTANAICKGVEGWDEGSWFGWNSTNNALDYFFCLDNLG